MSDNAISIRSMNKYYGGFHALKNVDFDVSKGEKVVICGPSGSGKSTLIRCINRLEEHQSGTIEVNGTPLPYIPQWIVIFMLLLMFSVDLYQNWYERKKEQHPVELHHRKK